jgi:hypothetical protein
MALCFNWSLNTDAQQQDAVSWRMLRADQLGRLRLRNRPCFALPHNH